MLLNDRYHQRRRTRLGAEMYADVNSVCSVTVSTLDRMALFQDSSLARTCLDLLIAQAEQSKVLLFAYCIMPDHLHLLMSPSEQKSIIDFVREFKGLSTKLAWRHGLAGRIWQAGFYDHFLRREEDIETAAHYILRNPIRREMVDDWKEYPFCGSMVYVL